jgi:hypothetical protein
MKTVVFSFLFFVNIGLFAQKSGDTIIAKNSAGLKLKIYYFHITERCHTCYAIEENLRKVVFGKFKNELNTGIIDLYIMNCEIPENKDLVKKYDAYGSTLALTKVENKKEKNVDDISNWAFQKAMKPELFEKELIDKINLIIK